MKIHCISHWWRVTSSLAIQLKLLWHDVTGHDDEIYEPSRSALAAHGLLANTDGRDPDSIGSDIDMIVLGMHAMADNPELLRAQELGLKIRSYPEVIYDLSKDKTRVVIAGSHGKTTTTSMIMHVLKANNLWFDWVVGGIVPGFDSMVSLSESNTVIIIEWDEYPDGKINMTAKMLLYKHNIGILNGIAWDHITTYPTFESYVAPFQTFVDQTPADGRLGFYNGDEEINKVMSHTNTQGITDWYGIHPHIIRDGITYLQTPDGDEVRLSVFWAHNCINISAAKLVCSQLWLSDEQFYSAIGSFTGAGNRLQLAYQDDDRNLTILRDFAHSPSKLTATISAVREQYPDRKIIWLFELHTFASLSASFMPEYKGSFDAADIACVYYEDHTFAVKRMTPLTKDLVTSGFARADLVVCDNASELKNWYDGLDLNNSVVVLMSSGNFGGVEFV
jgi:UDP-N-acetylmuramate: L-alanyl-gamma-D-glutamyl-meso-diaminopimelate ligase